MKINGKEINWELVREVENGKNSRNRNTEFWRNY